VCLGKRQPCPIVQALRIRPARCGGAGGSHRLRRPLQVDAEPAARSGAQLRRRYRDEDLRYDKIVVMTDVDGAHIASLLITVFYRRMPKLIENGHLYLVVPPLYRLSHHSKTFHPRDDQHKDELLKKE
jgi:hypothetical protein